MRPPDSALCLRGHEKCANIPVYKDPDSTQDDYGMTDESGGREVAPYDPHLEWTDSQWKEFIQEASRIELDAIIEKGRRITLFHRAFNRHPSRWHNRDWKVVCREVVGITNPTCSQYETIYEVFGATTDQTLRAGLPTSMYALYLIASAYKADPVLVRHLVDTRKLSSETERDEAKNILDLTRGKVEADPVERQRTRLGKVEKEEARMEEVIMRGLYRYRSEMGMSDESLTYFLYKWMEHRLLIDMLQRWREKYNDPDLVKALQFILETIEDSGKSGAANRWNQGPRGIWEDTEEVEK